MYNKKLVKREIKRVILESYTYAGTKKEGDKVHLIYRNGDKKENPVSFSQKFLDTNHRNISKILELVDEVLDFMNQEDSGDEEESDDGLGF